MERAFVYAEAFDRNIGWLTEGEQQTLRAKRVAIAGMGGVGGVHLLTLARFGIGGFTIADFDRFDLPNFNRQAGAFMSTLGQPKAAVMAAAARDINPEIRLRVLADGVKPDGIDDFLDGADLFVDGIDFFAIDIRARIFARCHERGIPAVTAAPIGMGTAWLAFVPGGMSFEEYFRLDGQPETEQFLRFLMGLAPRGLHRAYLMDPSRINLEAHRGPSTSASCQLCAGVASVAAVKLLLRRGDVRPAPWNHHFDPYVGRYAITRLSGGNNGAMQRIRLAAARRALLRPQPPSAPPVPSAAPEAPSAAPLGVSVLDEVLNAARWAPSGDNEQPWRFERTGDEAVLIHVRRKSPDNVYEYRDGEPLLLAAGMLLASLEIAASVWGRRLEWRLEGSEGPGGPHRIAARLIPAPGIAPDPLASVLSQRSVDRRPYRTRKLTGAEKAALEGALSGALSLRWHEGWAARWAIARLNAAATDIRLRAPETFETHRRVIDWSRRFSPSGIPAAALGLPAATLRLMRWQMADWRRTERMNRLGVTTTAAAQLDLRPGLACAAFFVLGAPGWDPHDHGAVLRAGAAIQRFWLQATRLGLAMQPALATAIFADYGARGIAFTLDAALIGKAARLAREFVRVLGIQPTDTAFLGRIGEPPPEPPAGRSVRRSLQELTGGDQAASENSGRVGSGHQHPSPVT